MNAMEELERILFSKNPILIAKTISALIENFDEKSEKSKQLVDFLIQKSLQSELFTSEITGKALVQLTENKKLDINVILTDLVTRIPNSKCINGLIKILCRLLYLEYKFKSEENDYNFLYNLTFPKHPFVAVLSEFPNYEEEIFEEIKYFYLFNDCPLEVGNELFKPVYLYSICNPIDTNLSYFKRVSWTFLLNLYQQNEDNSLINYLISWMTLKNKKLKLISDFLIDLLSVVPMNDKQIEVYVLWQITLIYYLVNTSSDPTFAVNSVAVIAKQKQLITINCLIIILAKTIEISCATYLNPLFNLCTIFLKQENIDELSVNILKSVILPWISNSCHLFEKEIAIAENIFHFCNNFQGKTSNNNCYDLNTFYQQNKWILNKNNEAFLAVQLSLVWQQHKIDSLSLWLTKLQDLPQSFIKLISNFIYGLFLLNHDEIALSSLQLLNKFNFNDRFLTLVLYKLSNTKNSQLHYDLLQSLPKFASYADNLKKVVATIQALSGDYSTLSNFSTILMYKAWKVNNKCYSYLEKLLLNKNKINIFETYTTKAFIMKELCEKKPELYGRDMVIYLSKLLNECKDNGAVETATACALAIEGISILCQNDVVDIISACNDLFPKFEYDFRSPVLKSICKLISEIPDQPQYDTYSEADINKVVQKLWYYVTENFANDVTGAALSALACFPLEQICQQIPDQFLNEQTLALKAESEGHVLFKVDGENWINLLNKLNVKITTDFLITLVGNEIKSYHQYIYQVKGNKEPINYDYLPNSSVVRAVGKFLKIKSSNWKTYKENYLACLNIFEQKYNKPLPPLDWTFLINLTLMNDELKYIVFNILSNQVILSGSARRFVESFIRDIVNNSVEENDYKIVYKNIKVLANSIQPMILQPFFEKSLYLAVDLFNENKTNLLDEIIGYFISVLKDENILEPNKITIGQVLRDILFATDETLEIFSKLLAAISNIPEKFLIEMTNFEKNSFTENKIIVIRTFLAKTQSLKWLSNILEQNNLHVKKGFLYPELLDAFKSYLRDTESIKESVMWIMDVIGQIQISVAQRSDEQYLIYLFEILILAVITFSGFSAYLDDLSDIEQLHDIFPQAFANLLDYEHWSICSAQALEWLYHTNSDELVTKKYRNLFGHTLQALRQDEEFTKNFKWMKFMNCKTNIC